MKIKIRPKQVIDLLKGFSNYGTLQELELREQIKELNKKIISQDIVIKMSPNDNNLSQQIIANMNNKELK